MGSKTMERIFKPIKRVLKIFLQCGGFLQCEGFLLRFKKKKDILLIAHNEIMFSYIRGIYEGLRKDKFLRIWFCFVMPDRFSPGNIKMLKAKYGFRSVSYRLARFIKWDLIIYPDHSFYFRKECKKIYIEHGLYGGKKVGGDSYVFGRRSCDENNKIIYDKIFESSEFIKEQVREYYPRFYSRVKVVGSMIGESIQGYSKLRESVLESINLDPQRKTVMFCSSWGPASFIQSQGIDFIKKVPNIAQRYSVILSVHLNNFVEKYSGGVNWRDILSKVNSKNTFVLLDRRESYRLLATADLLITDMTSLSLYYPILLRPIIFFDNPNVEYDPIGLIPELKKVAYVVKDIRNIEKNIQQAFDTFTPKAMEELNIKIISYLGNSWQRYAYEIYDCLSLK